MRILLVNKFHYLKGGSEKYYFELGDLLKQHGHEIAFFSMKSEKNIKTNELIVGQGHDSKYLISNHCIASECNWITDKPIEGKKYLAKFRYRQNDNEVTLKFLDDNKIEVFYPSGVRAVTPGQAVVIYDGEICLGGAIIDEVYFDNERRMY